MGRARAHLPSRNCPSAQKMNVTGSLSVAGRVAGGAVLTKSFWSMQRLGRHVRAVLCADRSQDAFVPRQESSSETPVSRRSSNSSRRPQRRSGIVDSSARSSHWRVVTGRRPIRKNVWRVCGLSPDFSRDATAASSAASSVFPPRRCAASPAVGTGHREPPLVPRYASWMERALSRFEG